MKQLNFYKGEEANLPQDKNSDNLYVTTDSGKVYLGGTRLHGLPLDNGIAEGSLQGEECFAGAKGYKIKSKDASNKYTLESVEGLSTGMSYVITASKNDARGGTITAINTSTNQVTLSGSTVALNGTADNTSSGDTYDYLTIIGHPEKGTLNTGYYAAAFGNGTTVYAKNGFAAGNSCAVVGKHGTSFGDRCLSGHAALSAGTGSKAYGSSSVAIGQYCTAGEHATLAAGYYTSTNYYGQTAVGRYNALNSNNDIFMVGAGTSSDNKYNCFAAGFQYNNGSITGGHAYIKVGGTYVRSDQLKTLTDIAEMKYCPYMYADEYTASYNNSEFRMIRFRDCTEIAYFQGIKYNGSTCTYSSTSTVFPYSVALLARTTEGSKFNTCKSSQVDELFATKTTTTAAGGGPEYSYSLLAPASSNKYGSPQAFYDAQTSVINTCASIAVALNSYDLTYESFINEVSFPDDYFNSYYLNNIKKITYKIKVVEHNYTPIQG